MRRRLSSTVAASLFSASVLLSATAGNAATVKTANAACHLVKVRVSVSRHFPISAIAFCDIIPESDSPKGYYILALHSTRRCKGICSTHMGWFSVQKATGGVFEWDVVEEKLGLPVNASP